MEKAKFAMKSLFVFALILTMLLPMVFIETPIAPVKAYTAEPCSKNKYKEVTLKFFVLLPNMTEKFTSSYVDKIVEDVNGIYFCQWCNDIRFVWNYCNVKVIPTEFLNMTNEAMMAALKEMKDCSKGINVVFVPIGYTDEWLGLTYMPSYTNTPCKGWSPGLGIKIRDTCNQTEMARVLAHELLHALGLSHEAQRWGGNVPPHGRGRCTHVPPRPNCSDEWDFDGDNDYDDMHKLLWGDNRAGTDINPDQYKFIWKSAEHIPCHAKKRYCTTTPIIWPSVPVFTVDDVSDVPTGSGYVDIWTSIAINYYDPAENTCLLSLDVMDNITDTKTLRYGFYLNTDNSTLTGSPDGILPGADFLAVLSIVPPVTEAKLWKYDGGWVEVQALDWAIADKAKDVMGIDFGYETWFVDTVIMNVPLGCLSLATNGTMQVRSFAEDVDAAVVDLSPTMLMPLEIVFPPLINLDPSSGSAGDALTVIGSGFTPNATISIEFDGTTVANRKR